MKLNGIKAGMFAILIAAAGLLVFSGCQLTQNGQTLPSPDYLNNQIQYHPSGNEFQYQKEVDLIKKENAERQLSQQGQYNY